MQNLQEFLHRCVGIFTQTYKADWFESRTSTACSPVSDRRSCYSCRTMNRNSISTDEELRQGDYLLSENGNYKAIFQHDGNFVIYTWRPTWASDTCGKNPFRILLQQDTNLVMYTKEDHPVWASGTFSNQHTTRMRLTLTNEGQLVLDNNGKKIWSAGEK
ncbi:comitin isoform X2 [Lates calcarifer]|uniref:Comitin isoform X2 n=1 Tax=Lates calcarifer TaxID=8187 RepID=A0AAJ7LAD6_LATCA|nr:comitin isoform X2 [Lates calcarifer]